MEGRGTWHLATEMCSSDSSVQRRVASPICVFAGLASLAFAGFRLPSGRQVPDFHLSLSFLALLETLRALRFRLYSVCASVFAFSSFVVSMLGPSSCNHSWSLALHYSCSLFSTCLT